MPIHEELINHAGRGLAMWNLLVSYTGDGTYIAAKTDLAGFIAANDAQEALTSIHETDKMIFKRANRYARTLKAMDIFTDSDIAATNTTALGQAQFTEDDPSLSANHRGSMP